MGQRDVEGIMLLVNNAISKGLTDAKYPDDATNEQVQEARQAHDAEQEEANVLAATSAIHFVLTRFDELVDALQEIAAQGRDRVFSAENGK